MTVERIRSPSVRNEARDEEEAAAVWSDGERSGRIEITSATERTGRRRRRRYAERGTWADRTRRAVARAHKLKPAPRRHCCLLRSPAPARPSSHALPHPPYRPSLRHPLWCPPNQPHPVPRRATPLLLPPPPPLPPSLPPSLSAPLPVHPQARETARCRTTEPPHVPTPPITRPPPILAPPPANPPLPAGRLLFALRDSALGLFSLPTAVPVAALVPFPPPPPLVLPLPRDARRHPLRANQHTRKPCALWNTTGSSAIIFCPIVCRACMRARECERGEGNGERMRAREDSNLEAI